AAALKLALNQLIAVHAAGFSLSLGIVERNDIDRQLFMEILRESSLYTSMYDKKLHNWVERDFSNPNFPTKHLQKDVRLISEHASEAGLNTGVLEAIRTIIDQSVERGCGDMDYSSIINVIHPRKE
ncbi:MAG: NAD-binding protein, partial [Candidatus Omnitrophica bacterium]|nr:NAD-binding protein [Candidatus Omnitrophota bacterium]